MAHAPGSEHSHASAPPAPAAEEQRTPRTPEEEQASAVVPQAGLSFRGGFGDIEQERYAVGRTFRHHGLLRASRDVRVATDNFADRDVVALYGADGRDVSATSEHPDEGETVFWPDPAFTVIAQTEVDDRLDARLQDTASDSRAGRTSGKRAEPALADRPLLTVVVVHGRADDPPTDVNDAVERAVHALAGARQIGPAVLTRPGRYRGPIGVDEHGQPASEDSSRPEPPGAARSRPEPPGAARSRPEPPGAARDPRRPAVAGSGAASDG